MNSLKQKTVSGLLWSIIDNLAKYGLQFIVGIILARLLSPTEFGLVGMITIFISISNSLVDSGFSQALIRKNNAEAKDFSTVFIFNLAFSIIVFCLLFLSANAIGSFFEQPKLVLLVRVFAINIIINAFALVQRTKLTKDLDFKTQTKISLLSGSISGLLAIVLAYNGAGVWSLVAKTTIFNILTVLLLWYLSKWKPQLVFSSQSFKELFSFGSKMVAAGLLDTLYRNVYYVVIGKYFTPAELGFYTRAEQFNNLPSSNLTTVIQRVSYPALSQLQDDKVRLKQGYKKVITSTMFVSFISMLGMAAIAEPMILTLIGEKWEQSIAYLQLLCFVGMLYPLHGINLNMLKVQGRSDLFLKLEIIKKLIAIPTIVIGIFWGIKIIIIGMIVNSIIAYFLNSYWSGKLINYSMREQILDITPSFLLAIIMAIIVYFIGSLLPFSNFYILIIQIITGGIIVFSFCELTKMNAYIYIKDTVKSKLKNSRNGER
jgi:O-antigen/teichoic acid export membrane protein